MSRDDDKHIVRTTPRRLGKGLVIVVGIMIVGAVYAIAEFDHMNDVPPPSSKLKPEVNLQELATFERPTAAPASLPHRNRRLHKKNQPQTLHLQFWKVLQLREIQHMIHQT